MKEEAKTERRFAQPRRGQNDQMTEAIKTRALKPICDSLADLLDYPDENWTALVEAAANHFADEVGEGPDAFTSFCENTGHLSLTDLQELYTRTFDLSPVCALDIGYHLFGENYKRGVFLASLRETEAPFELGQEHQLPDYLPVLLRLLTKLDDKELRASLIAECLLPALAKMQKALADGENPYRHLIQTVRSVWHSEAREVSGRFVDRVLTPRASLPVLTNDPGSFFVRD